MLSGLLSKIALTKKEISLIILGSAIMAFGIVNIHMPSQITEGGVLGLVLFSHKVLGLDPSVMSVVFDLICYALAFHMMGWTFLQKAFVASTSFALAYKLCLALPNLLPNFYQDPFLAAVLGGIFVGVGCGLVVTQGGAAGGDDALAMVISNKMGGSISRAYLLTDSVVLLLSLTYIAPQRLIFSFITTLVSSFLIGQFEIHLSRPKLVLPKVSPRKVA